MAHTSITLAIRWRWWARGLFVLARMLCVLRRPRAAHAVAAFAIAHGAAFETR